MATFTFKTLKVKIVHTKAATLSNYCAIILIRTIHDNVIITISVENNNNNVIISQIHLYFYIVCLVPLRQINSKYQSREVEQ